MKTYIFIILFGLVFSVNAQELHHQMISAQGTSTTTTTGLVVKQTIGQQSVAGTSTEGVIVQQGFQQSFWHKHVATNTPGLSIATYPNPFESVINFQFSELIESVVQISVFDVQGRLVFSTTLPLTTTLLTIDLPFLSHGEYLVRLSGNKINYFTKIIKKL